MSNEKRDEIFQNNSTKPMPPNFLDFSMGYCAGLEYGKKQGREQGIREVI